MDIAIDLGTTNSGVSYVDPVDGKVKLIKNREGSYLTPSYQHFTSDVNGKIKVLIGARAKAQMSIDPANVVSSYKTFMGSGKFIKTINLNGITAEQCSALALKQLVEDAENALGEKVTGVFISVPARFDEPQRTATKEAAILAGLNVIGLIDEPTAAAFYHAVNPKKGSEKEESTVMCVDIGGGTSDTSIIQLFWDNGKVLAKGGDAHLGGDDFDRLLAQYLIDNCGVWGSGQFDNKDLIDKVIQLAEKIKIELCTFPNKTIPAVMSDFVKDAKTVNVSMKIFDKVTQPLIDRIALSTQETLDKIQMTYEDLDDVMLVGGSSRIPAIRKLLSEQSGGKFSYEYFDAYIVDPDLAVCLGAGTVLKYRQDGKEGNLSNIVSNPVGIEDIDGNFKVVLKAGRMVPCSCTQIFSNSRDNQDIVSVNIYEGCSIHAQDNTFLGTLNIKVPSCSKGMAKIKVTMKMDINNTLHCKVTCNDKVAEFKLDRKYKVDAKGIEAYLNQNTSDVEVAATETTPKGNTPSSIPDAPVW